MKQVFLNDEDFFKSTKLSEDGITLLKAKKMPVGTVSKGMKKIAEGKWAPVKKAGKGKLTQKVVDGIVKKEKPEFINAEVKGKIERYKKNIEFETTSIQNNIKRAVEKLSTGKLDWGNVGSLGSLYTQLNELNREIKNSFNV